MPLRRRALLASLAAPGGAALAQGTLAQGTEYPTRPIRAVVPSSAGGPPDLTLRALAPRMQAVLGQPIAIDNRGGNVTIGTAVAARAPADGSTLLFGSATHVNAPPFVDNVPYDPLRDFLPVTLAAQNFGQALVVRPGLPETLPGLIELARREPGRLTYANAGNGTASHIPAELLKSRTGTDILSVPYRGVAEAMADLLGGRTDMFFIGTQVALEQVRAGRLRALALTGPRRWKGMPEVPTMQELGLPGFEVTNWFGIWLPAGAPAVAVQRLHAAVAAAVADPEVRAQFDTLGLEGIAMPPAEFAAFVAAQAGVAQEIGRRVQRG